MEERKYTAGEVHQILDMVLSQMNFRSAPGAEQEPKNLENDIAHKASSSDAKLSLTVSEAAGMIGICKPKLYELIHGGQFHTLRIGRKILISRQSVLDWIQGGIENGKKAC